MGYVLRILIFGLVVAVVVLLIKHRQRPRARFEPPPAKPVGDMLRCEYCGVYVPRSEATVHASRSYCSLEHARKGPRPQ